MKWTLPTHQQQSPGGLALGMIGKSWGCRQLDTRTTTANLSKSAGLKP